MADSSTSVRFLQHHLRQAGALLASKELGAASAHIDAALAIDPGSLAALTLRERLEACRASDSSRRDTAIPPASPEPTPSRFVPAGVDAASWLDFEKRVQERRFRALLETAERAVGTGNDAAARSALEEARELYPDSGELELLSARVALVSNGVRERVREPLLRSRPLRAAALLVVGVSLLMGLDWVRSDSRTGKIRAPLTGARKSLAGVAFAEGTPAPETVPDPNGSNHTTDIPTVPVANIATELETPPNVAPVLGGSPTDRELKTSATSGGELSSSETADEYVARKPWNPREQAVVAPVLSGEIPDYYVATPRPAAARIPAGESATGGASSATGPITSVMRQPGPGVDTVGTGRLPTAVGSLAPAPLTAPPALAAPAATAAAPASNSLCCMVEWLPDRSSPRSWSSVFCI